MHLIGKLSASEIQPGSRKIIAAKVRPNALLDEDPPAHPSDELNAAIKIFLTN
jgi:hypothetical protein